MTEPNAVLEPQNDYGRRCARVWPSLVRHGRAWWLGGRPGGIFPRQARAHLHRWNGVTFSLEEHHELHTQWINERHQFGQFSLTPLSASPERVRAVGTVYWQKEVRERPPPN